MGLAASSGHDNDDLIDKLIDANIVVTHRVEIALRLVDRRRFFPVEGRYIAYKDLAWKSDFGSPGRIHISAPCIYGNVLECLDLQEGNSFLNVGSGTGYLSTVAGYLLGSNGTNHGVEIHPNIVEYARSLVVETLHCPETQCYDWAIPQFSCGNGLHLSPSHYSKYDRVYCGAAVPPSHRRILWELLKVDGILVMPYEDQLLQVRRQAPNVFDVKIITSVSFSDFIPPTEEETSKELYSNAPSFRTVPTLQFLCALSIRKIIRAAVATNHKIHIRNFVGQQPHRIRENHVVVQFRDGEQPVAQQVHFENRHPPLREILAIVGADFIGDDENEVNDDMGEADPRRRRRLVRDRFRMVWFRHHLRAHIANRVVRRRRPLETEAEAQEGDAEIEDNQNSDVEITDENENSEYSGSGSLSATTSDPTDTSIDTTESCNDSTSATGRSKKRSLEECDGESSLSVKRRNDDEKAFTDKETMEVGLVNDCKTQTVPEESLPDKNGSSNESSITPIAQETSTQPEESANQKSEENIPEQSEHFEEAENSNNLKFVERAVESNEGSVSHWAEVIEQLRDLRRREAEDNRIIVMGSISKHNGNSFRSSLRDQSIDSCQNLTEVQNGITRSNDSGNSNHDGKYEQESSKSANLSVQIQNSKIHNEANDEKWVNNLTSTNIHSTKSDEMENALRANRGFFPSSKGFDTKDDELMWQNNKLYKNKSETSSAERYNSNENLVGNSSGKSGILSTSNSELEQDNRHLITNVEGGNSDNDGDNDDYDDDGDDADDDDNNDDDDDGDDDDDDDSDDDSDDSDDEDGSAYSSSSNSGDQEDNPERNNGNHFYPVDSRDENGLYLAVHETARNMTAAVNEGDNDFHQ
ncbi:protein-L-isoaspartate O-methyltransferase, partial [Wuchereria bancrofti]